MANLDNLGLKSRTKIVTVLSFLALLLTASFSNAGGSGISGGTTDCITKDGTAFLYGKPILFENISGYSGFSKILYLVENELPDFANELRKVEKSGWYNPRCVSQSRVSVEGIEGLYTNVSNGISMTEMGTFLFQGFYDLPQEERPAALLNESVRYFCMSVYSPLSKSNDRDKFDYFGLINRCTFQGNNQINRLINHFITAEDFRKEFSSVNPYIYSTIYGMIGRTKKEIANQQPQ
ncbi:MAG: hypothetical protein ACXVCY_06375 [Pseudobdellovibrionaceae bacterium]